MKAVIMAGGEGARLRPLTINRPKPMVSIVDRPVIVHIIELLKRHGITEIVVTVQYLANMIQDYLGDGSTFGVHIDYSVEEVPLGTAGAIRQAADLLDEPFLVISGDALTDFDLSEVINFHQQSGALATLTLTRVRNPLEYGVIITDDSGRVRQFLEKPTWGQVFSDTVNTGIYVLDPQVFKFIEKGVALDWSRDIFPHMLRQGHPIYGYIIEGYWTDVGTIEEYMRASADYLSGKVNLPRLGTNIGGETWAEGEVEVAPDAQLYGPIFLGHGVKVKSGVLIHGPTFIRDYTIVDTRASIDRSIVWRNSYIGERAELRGAIVGKQCNIKSRAVLFEGVVVGDGTVINSGAVIQPNVKIWPSKEVEEGATVSTSIIWGSQGRRVLFGRYGITGLVNIDITPEFCAKLGAAYGAILEKGSRVTINRDVHYTPRMLKRGLISGLPSAGVNVMELHSVPIPVARFMTNDLGTAGGVHVRLSPFDNRVVDIKFFDHRGLDLDPAIERKIENTFFREDFRRVYLDEVGRIHDVVSIQEPYTRGFLKALKRTGREALEDFNVVIDYANANAASILSPILRQLSVDLLELNANPDEEHLYQTTAEFEEGMARLMAIVPVLGADLGVRFDSGGERLFLVDDRGQRLSGMEVLAAVAALVLQQNGGGRIAVPVTAPRFFEHMAARYGGELVRSKANLSALMQMAADDPDMLLLGDGAGSLIFPSFYPVVDALFAAVKIMELLALQNRRLSEVLRSLPRSFMATSKVPCRWENKGKVMRILNEQYSDQRLDQIDGIKIDLGDEWVLVLPDADGPFFHVIAEGASDEQARILAEKYAGLLMGLQ